MKALIQRVQSASVSVDDKTISSIQTGFLVFLGVEETDTPEDLQYIIRKTCNLRVFQDTEGRMNRSLSDVSGSILLVSQFTLCADTKKGNRPSFHEAAAPQKATEYYEKAVELIKKENIPVETGEFGAHMIISLVNDGPVTIHLDSAQKPQKK
jgi:D-tyrosyl-tRNA(Tyr) deacylase